MTTEIGLLLYPEVQLAAVHGLTDLFRIAGWQAKAIAPESDTAIRVTHWQQVQDGEGVECVQDTHPGTPHAPRYVIVPPSLVMPGAMAPATPFASWMREAHARGTTLCSVCAGAFVLGETGLLAGRQATTHWAFAEGLSRRFPDIQVDSGRMVIDDGDIITAGGILAWTDLGLRLVERLMGHAVMLATARFLLVDPPGRDQRAYAAFIPRLDHGDAGILSVQHWLQATGAREATVAAMAAKARLEPRTFLRRFSKATGLRPTEYCQQIRIAKAREMLELTRRPVEQIGWSIGYEDATAFRKLFHRVTGLAPGEYRRRFGSFGGAAAEI